MTHYFQPLPDRATNQTADEMCKATKECAPKFLQLETRVRVRRILDYCISYHSLDSP